MLKLDSHIHSQYSSDCLTKIDDIINKSIASDLNIIAISDHNNIRGSEIAVEKTASTDELLVVPSPVAIFKGTTKLDASKKFVDYLLGQEAQAMVAAQGTIPVREDVKMPNKYFKLPTPKEALAKSIKINYTEALKTQQQTKDKFAQIMQVKK